MPALVSSQTPPFSNVVRRPKSHSSSSFKRVNIVLGPSGEIVLIICSVPRFPILPELRKMNCCVCRKELASRKKTT